MPSAPFPYSEKYPPPGHGYTPLRSRWKPRAIKEGTGLDISECRPTLIIPHQGGCPGRTYISGGTYQYICHQDIGA